VTAAQAAAKRDRRSQLKFCRLYTLCHTVETTAGDTVTVRPGAHLNLRGNAAKRAIEVLMSLGCTKIGRAYSKLYCPKARLMELCKLFKALIGA
jgi:hypothetical protein